jgi:hypothetical protein
MSWFVPGAAAVALLVSAAPARADTGEPPYPVAQVARPLVLPAGATEAGGRALVVIDDRGDTAYTYLELAPSVRHSVGRVELEAGARVLLAAARPENADEELDRLRALALAARWRLAADRALGLQLELEAPGLTAAVRPQATLDQRWHLTARSSVTAGAGLGGEHLDTTDGGDPAVTSFIAVGRVRVAAQLTGAIALEAHARVRLRRPLELEPDHPRGNTSTTLESGVGLVAALGRNLDLVAGLDVVETGEADGIVLGVGLIARRIP